MWKKEGSSGDRKSPGIAPMPQFINLVGMLLLLLLLLLLLGSSDLLEDDVELGEEMVVSCG
jgi:hypothetical protein